MNSNKRNKGIRSILHLNFGKGQEEIMGFGIILILVAVILIVFLGVSKNNGQEEGSTDYEITSFMNSFLQVSTYCEDKGDYFSVRDLAFECLRGNSCNGEEDPCEVLGKSVVEIMEVSWQVGENHSSKGYELSIVSQEGLLIDASKGSKTNSYRGSSQDYSKSGDKIEIYLKVYS